MRSLSCGISRPGAGRRATGAASGREVSAHVRLGAPFPDVTLAHAAITDLAPAEAPPVVLVHGLASHRYMRPLLRALAPRHRDRVRALVLQGPAPDPSRARLAGQVLRWLRNGRREPSFGLVLLLDYRDAGPRRMMKAFLGDFATPS